MDNPKPNWGSTNSHVSVRNSVKSNPLHNFVVTHACGVRERESKVTILAWKSEKQLADSNNANFLYNPPSEQTSEFETDANDLFEQIVWNLCRDFRNAK